jgi:cytidine deaminase
MAEKRSIQLDYHVYHNLEELDEADQDLIKCAYEAAANAYAPYSKFRVGAAALLQDGSIVQASNKENAAFPAGICAERNLVFASSDLFPGVAIMTISIIAVPDDFELNHPVTPCGICRQVLCETETNQMIQIRILLRGSSGMIYKFDSCSSLLPLHFHLNDLKG